MKIEVAMLYSIVTCVRLHLGAKKKKPTGFVQAGRRRQLTSVATRDSAGAYDKYSGGADASCECYIHCHALIKGCRRYEIVIVVL